MTHKLIWHQTWDDDDNSIWEAAGPYGEDGSSIADWRLVHKLVGNKPVWVAEHDADLQGIEDGQWLNLGAAKSDIEKVHNEILEENDGPTNL